MKKIPIQNAGLYDRLLDVIQKMFSYEDETNWMLAFLHPYHPTRPDTSRFMQISKSDATHVQSWFRPLNYHGGLDALFTMCALAQRCLADDRRSGATWVLNNAYDRAPHLFSGGATLKSFKAKASAAAPAPITWSPSKTELEKGVQVDQDGNINFSQKAREALDYPSRDWTTFV